MPFVSQINSPAGGMSSATRNSAKQTQEANSFAKLLERAREANSRPAEVPSSKRESTLNEVSPLDTSGRVESDLEDAPEAPDELRETFHQFVGEMFFGQMMASMRDTLGKPAYFHGGQAEEVFQGQLDQILAEKMAKSSAESFAEPMFQMFMQGRSA